MIEKGEPWRLKNVVGLYEKPRNDNSKDGIQKDLYNKNSIKT